MYLRGLEDERGECVYITLPEGEVCRRGCSAHRIKEARWRSFRRSLPDNWRRRDGRVAEGARLESVYTGNRIVGSNPTLSAKQYGGPTSRKRSSVLPCLLIWPRWTRRLPS